MSTSEYRLPAAPVSGLRLIIVSAGVLRDPRRYAPISERFPEETALCCFTRTEDERSRLLDSLRDLAGQPKSTQPDVESTELRLGWDRASNLNLPWEMLAGALRWWCGVKGNAYHVYRLKLEVAPFRSSCLITFQEPDPEELREMVLVAKEVMESERDRVASFFGGPTHDYAD